MWELDCEESWALKIDAFELWCWRRLLRVPWTARRSNQEEILKEVRPEYSLEGLMLKLKFQYFGHLMQRVDSLEKTLILGGIEGRKRRGRQRMRWLDGITDSWTWVSSGSWRWTGRPGVLRFTGWQSRTRLSDWTALNCTEHRWLKALDGGCPINLAASVTESDCRGEVSHEVTCFTV